MKKISRLLPALLLLSLIACNNDEEGPTKTEMLTSEQWNFSYMEYNEGGSGYNELLGLYHNLQVTFNSSGTYSITTELDSSSGIWAFNEDETSITFDAGSTDEFDADLVTLNEYDLTLSWEESISVNDGTGLFVTITKDLVIYFQH